MHFKRGFPSQSCCSYIWLRSLLLLLLLVTNNKNFTKRGWKRNAWVCVWVLEATCFWHYWSICSRNVIIFVITGSTAVTIVWVKTSSFHPLSWSCPRMYSAAVKCIFICVCNYIDCMLRCEPCQKWLSVQAGLWLTASNAVADGGMQYIYSSTVLIYNFVVLTPSLSI